MKRGPKAPATSKKNKGGRPPHVPTPQTKQQVEILCGVGLNQDEIELVMDISESTLKRHYKRELRVGGLKADARVLTNLYRKATGTDADAAKAMIFWVKVRRRWHEVQRVIHGYNPEMINQFVRSTVQMLRRELPEA